MGKRKVDYVLDDEFDENDRGLKTNKGESGAKDIHVEVKVIGEKIKEEKERMLYHAFEVDGNNYEIDDPVLVTPETTNQKPYVAIIKKIMQAKDGTIQIEGQWFYRPEEAEKKGGGTWTSSDSRELFYSFHIDDVPAESIMHKCQVYFIPPNKQLPNRQKYPGFIVHWVYDACGKKLFNLSDKDYEDPMQQEIDFLVRKTREALGELPEVNQEEYISRVHEDVALDLKPKRKVPAKRTLAPLHLPIDECNANEPKIQTPIPSKKVDHTKVETPTSAVGTDLEISTLLKNHDVFLGVHARDRWLEKLMQTIQNLCGGGKGFNLVSGDGEDIDKDISDINKGYNYVEVEGNKQCLERHGKFLIERNLVWPTIATTAIEVVTAIERLSYNSLGNDLHKYNLKMRQLDFNIKNNEVLARRLLTKELEPVTVLNMSPIELKDGYITTKKKDQEPPKSEAIQMANVRCSICTEREVGVIDIIHVSYGDRYQLECLKCGNTWYAARDAVSSLRAANIISNVQ